MAILIIIIDLQIIVYLIIVYLIIVTTKQGTI